MTDQLQSFSIETMAHATIDDVASHSGFSVATVSRAVRGLPNVSPATRKKVLESASSLEYQPNPNASGLAGGRTGIVTMVVAAISSWYMTQVMAGAEAELATSGVELSVTFLSKEATVRVLSNRRLIARRSDGLILLDFVPQQHDSDPALPTVVVGNQSPDFDSVAIDNMAGGRLAGEHIMQLGHRRVSVIAGTRDEFFNRAGSERMSGFLQSAEQFGVDPATVRKEYGNYSALGGYEAMTTLLSAPRETRPTAVFALCDDMAVGALRAASDAGCRIPEDLSLVGFDDHELAFGFGLTTIAQEPERLGAIGAKMLMDRLDGLEDPPRSVECSMELVERASTRSVRI